MVLNKNKITVKYFLFPITSSNNYDMYLQHQEKYIIIINPEYWSCTSSYYIDLFRTNLYGLVICYCRPIEDINTLKESFHSN